MEVGSVADYREQITDYRGQRADDQITEDR